MRGGAAKVAELMRHLGCREFQAFSCVGLNVNDVTFSSSSESSVIRPQSLHQMLCVADIKMTTRLFLSISIPLEIFSWFYCRWEKCIMLQETKSWLHSYSWIIAILSQRWLKSKIWYRSLNEMLANIFLPHWKCNLSIEHFVPVNFICTSILHLNQRGAW